MNRRILLSNSGIQYAIAAERRRVEDAQRRWRRLAGRATALADRCASAGLTGIDVPARPAGDSAAISAACDRLEARCATAMTELEQAETTQRSEQLGQALREVLAAAALRAAARARTETVDTVTESSAPVAELPPLDIAERRARLLGSLLEHSAEIDRAAATISVDDAARARLLLDDLSSRVAAANAATRLLRAEKAEIIELRADTDGLVDPGGAVVLLDRAESEVCAGRSAASLLHRVRQLIEERITLEGAARDRSFVLDAVEAALTELGYAVVPVGQDTADSIVARAPGSTRYGLRARVVDGEIDVRTVDTGAGSDDAAAEAAVCADLRTLPESLRQRGVLPERVRQSPPGTAAKEHVALPAPQPTTPNKRRRKPAERSRE
ncbi:hypothetical protein ACQPW1_24650 [Nocardia sp. CA-128927]|uniref:hypothetical protein n=1 Tax=Nocardia sp. CA-128927 TaxID=3239975 RepID=UPI003D96EF99